MTPGSSALLTEPAGRPCSLYYIISLGPWMKAISSPSLSFCICTFCCGEGLKDVPLAPCAVAK